MNFRQRKKRDIMMKKIYGSENGKKLKGSNETHSCVGRISTSRQKEEETQHCLNSWLTGC